MSKTSGGTGTNQYRVRGRGRRRALSADQIALHVASQRTQDKQLALARDLESSQRVLLALATSDHASVRDAVVANPHSSREALQAVVDCGSNEYRRWHSDDLLRHPNCPPEILALYATSNSISNRELVASNPSTPANFLIKLGQSKVPEIRKNAINNPTYPAHLRAIHALGR